MAAALDVSISYFFDGILSQAEMPTAPEPVDAASPIF